MTDDDLNPQNNSTTTDGDNQEEIATDEDNQREQLIRRLAVQTGLPLTPTPATQIDRHFDNDSIIVDYYPVKEVRLIKVDENCICLNECLMDKESGLIYLPKKYIGTLFLQYIYCIPEEAYMPIIDLMIEYENDLSWDKDASSITEGGVTVSLNTSVGKGPLIQSMINDLRYRYNATARMI